VGGALGGVRRELDREHIVVARRRADDAAYVLPPVCVEVDPGVLDRHEGGDRGHLGEPGHALGPLAVQVPFGNEVPGLAGDSAAVSPRIEGRDGGGRLAFFFQPERRFEKPAGLLGFLFEFVAVALPGRLASDRLGRPLARTGIGMGALTTDRQPTAVAEARLTPKTEATEPGASTACGVTPAPLTIPEGRM